MYIDPSTRFWIISIATERRGDATELCIINQLDYEAKSFYGVQGGKNIILINCFHFYHSMNSYLLGDLDRDLRGGDLDDLRLRGDRDRPLLCRST